MISRDYVVCIDDAFPAPLVFSYGSSTSTDEQLNSSKLSDNITGAQTLYYAVRNPNFGTQIRGAILPYLKVSRSLSGYDDTATPLTREQLLEIIANPANYTVEQQQATYVAFSSTHRVECVNDDHTNYFTIGVCGAFLLGAISRPYTLSKVENNCTFTFEQSWDNGSFSTRNNGATIGVPYRTRIIATPNQGYKFTSVSQITFSPDYVGDEPNVTISNGSITAVFYPAWKGTNGVVNCSNWQTSGTITVTATPQPEVINGNILVVESSKNCVVNGVPESGLVATGTSVTLLAIANEGYYFNGRPYIRYTGTDGAEHKLFMSRLSNDTRATVTHVFSEIAQNGTTAYIVCNAVAIPLQENNVTVQTQVNCTVSAPTTYTENDIFSATATPNEGYRFDTAPTVTFGETVLNFTVDSETGVASFNQVLQNVPEGATIFVNATANLIPAKTYPIVQNLTNCTVQGVPESGVYTEGETLSLTLTANSGYYFDVPPRLYFEGNGGQTGYFDFTINPDNDTIATLSKTLSNLKDDSNITISANAVPQTTYTDKYGSINVYNVTVDNLTQFAEERFITVGTEDVAEIDLGKYVSKLFRLYCDIGNTTESTLKVANYDLTNINVQVPVNDIVTVDCGTITVTGKNGTANDFNGELQIFLPFIGLQSLNIDKALNNPLHLYYKINIVTGEAVAILEIDEIPSEFWDCKACQEILYLSHTQETFSDYEFKSKFLYGFTPFIIYKYNTDFNTSPVNADSVRMKVSECEGYFEMTETTPFNAQNMNETERARIIELLASGVFYGAEFPNT
jgi:hypothetical protein